MSMRFKIWFLSLAILLWVGVVPAWAQVYRVGDLYTAPDGSQGIVYWLNPDGSGGWVVALNDASTGCSWGEAGDVPGLDNRNPGNSNRQQLLTDTAGHANTQAIRSYQNNAANTAAGVVDFAHGWYLPSPAQLSILYGQLPFIEAALVAAGGSAPTTGKYWCSAEVDGDNAWYVIFSYGYFNSGGKTSSNRVRAVRSFTYPSADGVTYVWNTGATGNDITVSSAGTYSVTATNPQGCADADTMTVAILPFVTTGTAKQTGNTAAYCGGNVTAEGSSAVVGRGVCWSAHPNPTVSDSHTTDGSGTGTFTSTLTGLQAGTTYHVRAYATNSAGTAYGDDVTLTLYTVVPKTGTETLSLNTDQTVTIYDHGGPGASYDNSCGGMLVVTTPNPTDRLIFTGAYSVEERYDKLYIYDGNGTDNLLMELTGTNGSLPVPIKSSRNTITLRFTSDASVTYSGFALNMRAVNCLMYPDTTAFDTIVCSNDLPLSWNGLTLSQAGFYTVNLQEPDGCDSVVTMNLYVAQQGEFSGLALAGTYFSAPASEERFVMVTDYDNDNKKDLITRIHPSGEIRFYRSTGSTYAYDFSLNAQSYAFSAAMDENNNGQSSNISCLQDFDNDGILDLLVHGSNFYDCTSNSVRVYWGAATHPYFNDNSYVELPVTAPYCIGTYGEDLNHDGLLDIFIRNCRQTNLYMNNGNRQFTQTSVFNTGRDINVIFDDYDADGNVDLCYTKNGWASGGWGIRLNKGNGDGTFNTSTISNYDSERPLDGFLNFQANPLDNTLPDIAFTCSNDGTYNSTIYVGEWNGSAGNFQFHTLSVTPSDETRIVQAFDINGDSYDDLIIRSRSGDFYSAKAYINDGHGNFPYSISILKDSPYYPYEFHRQNGQILMVAYHGTSRDQIVVYEINPVLCGIDALPCPGTPTVTDYDGNVYNTIQLGNQCWMKENLRTTHYADGTTVVAGTVASYTVPYRYDYSASNIPLAKRGYLYNWPAVMHGTASSSSNPSSVQGVCPTGWHLPSNAEWTQMIDYVGSVSAYRCGGSSSYIAKSLSSTESWTVTTSNCRPGNGQESNNATGFGAYPVGYYCTDGFLEPNIHAAFWSATETGTNTAGRYYLSNSNTSMDYAQITKRYGLSVRCVLGAADSQPCTGHETVSDYDGNVYNTIQLGNQCWMKENLRTTHFADGVEIPASTTVSSTEAYRHLSGSNPVATYGYLYNWTAVMHGAASSSANPSAVQGVCPAGWHVPSDAEWTQLTDYLSSQSRYVCGDNSSNVAKALAATTGWAVNTNSNTTCTVGGDQSTNNTTGFGAMQAGGYFSSGYSSTTRANLWSCTQSSDNIAWYRYLSYLSATVGRNNQPVSAGYSVRCLLGAGNTRAAAVGDILCTDGTWVSPGDYAASGKTAMGVIFHVDDSGYHGWAVNPSEYGVMAWGGYGTDIPTLPNSGETDTAGYSNTQIIRSFGDASTYPAAWWVDFNNGWYLPAARQLLMLYEVRDTVNATLSIIGGTVFGGDGQWWCWSSTEAGYGTAWALTYQGSLRGLDYKGAGGYRVYSIRSF